MISPLLTNNFLDCFVLKFLFWEILFSSPSSASFIQTTSGLGREQICSGCGAGVMLVPWVDGREVGLYFWLSEGAKVSQAEALLSLNDNIPGESLKN